MAFRRYGASNNGGVGKISNITRQIALYGCCKFYDSLISRDFLCFDKKRTSRPITIVIIAILFMKLVTSEKYLGVYLNHDLKWSHHIDQVTAKAARKLGFVRRNLRGSPVDCKKLAYISLVRSVLAWNMPL